MYPSRFRYEAPRSVDEAISLLHDGGDDAKVLAGGQSLVPMMKLRFASPELLVDINGIPGLDYHRAEPDGSLHVGALARHADLEWSQLLKDTQPTMAAAAPVIADPLVRNRGTLVGSLCHADPQGDWAAVMLALGASVIAQGPGGRRAIAVADFVAGPFENALEHDEIAVEAVVPPAQGTREGGYLKLERRIGDFATCGVAVALELSGAPSASGTLPSPGPRPSPSDAPRGGRGVAPPGDSWGTVIRAGIGLTGVGGSTISASEAAAALVGKPLTPEVIEAAASLAASAAQPHGDHRGSAAYKRHMVATFTARILAGIAAATTERAA
jgi:carbon-monoxide dehydrogenase medium subunit